MKKTLKRRLFPKSPLLARIIIWTLIALLLAGAFIFEKSLNVAVPASFPPWIPISNAKEIVWGDRSKQQVIFTFDGGDGSQSAEGILQALAAHHVKGTFFLTGKFVEANPALVLRMATSGNEIFDHTYDHPHLTSLPGPKITWELNMQDAALAVVTGSSSRPYFRAPYGDRDPRVLAMAAHDGYRSVYWTVDARDWMEPQGETADEVEQRILSSVAPGTIYLMHLGDTTTGSILNDVFTKIEARGYKIVSLTQGL